MRARALEDHTFALRIRISFRFGEIQMIDQMKKLIVEITDQQAADLC